MRSTRLYAAMVLSAITLAGCAQPGAVDRAKRTSTAAAVVTMNGFKYEPVRVSIRSGETVEWVNTDAVMKHTVTADARRAKTQGSVSLPAGAAPFDSGLLQPGQKFKYTFTIPGTYRYFCIPHERYGMVGEVQVR